jgi:hypothetical protein
LTYFEATRIENVLAVDGGVWANSPTTVALAEAAQLGWNLADVRMLSVGTLFTPNVLAQPFEIDDALVKTALAPLIGKLGATAAGLLLLATGCSWRVRELPGQRDAGVGFLLSVGSVVAAGPVLWNVLGNRWSGGRPVLFDEMLLVTALLPLVVTGCGVRIRSAAFVGVGGMAIYLLTLFANLVYRPELAVGIYLGVGGLMIFLIGIALSVWRDRILEIPGRIAGRRGIFQVIDWR